MRFDTNNDIIAAGQFMLQESKRFAEPAFDPIAIDCVAHSPRHRQSKPIMRQFVRNGVDDERPDMVKDP